MVWDFLAFSLLYQVWHPTITWGCYRNWDFKTPFEEAPMFYEGVDDKTAEYLTAISDEILQIKKVLESKFGLNLTGLRHVKEWMVRSYADDIADKSSLKTMINTNKVNNELYNLVRRRRPY
jgi:hypothetical protein